MKCYVINLDSQIGRWENISIELSRFGIEPERISAINGKKILNGKRAPFSKEMLRYLTPGEYGCLLSHKKIWERIVHQKGELALVLEDDVFFSEGFRELVENVQLIDINKVDVVHLEETGKGDSFIGLKDKVIPFVSNTLVEIVSPVIGAGALIITKSAAKRLLSLSQDVFMPVDELLFNKYSPIFGKINTYQVTKPVVFQLVQLGISEKGDFVSTLESGRGNKESKSKNLILHTTKVLKKIAYLYKVYRMKNRTNFVLDFSEKKNMYELLKNK